MGLKEFIQFYQNILVKTGHVKKSELEQMLYTESNQKSNFFYITAKNERLSHLMLNFKYLIPRLEKEQADVIIIKPNSNIDGVMINVIYKNIPQSMNMYKNWIKEYVKLSFLERFKFSSIIPFLFIDVQNTDSLFCQGNIDPTVIKILTKILSEGVIFVNEPDKKKAKDNYNFGSENLCVISYEKSQDIPQIVPFDKVVCIAPSSNDGAIFEDQSDWSVEKAISNQQIQKDYLKSSLKKLKPGGICVYSTFSINPIENEDVINSVLNEFDNEFNIIDCSQEFNSIKRCQGLTDWDNIEFYPKAPNVPNIHFCMRFYSHLIHSDSIFVAVIQRVSSKNIEIQTQDEGDEKAFSNLPGDILNNIVDEFGFNRNDFNQISFLCSKKFKDTIFHVSSELQSIIKTNETLKISRIGSPSFVFNNADIKTIPIPSYIGLPSKRVICIDYDTFKKMEISLSIEIEQLPSQTQEYLKSIKTGGIYIEVIPSEIKFGAYLNNKTIQIKMSSEKFQQLFDKVKFFTFFRPVGIGKSDFYEIRQNNCLYVDKTDFISSWWNRKDQVTLITRPHRFGKTLVLSMVKYFFSFQYKDEGATIFEKTKIWNDKKMMQKQGNYPVISITFVSIKSNNVNDIIFGIKQEIINVFMEFTDILLSSNKLNEIEIDFIKSINSKIDNDVIAARAIFQLCSFINKVLGKKTIILLDEYDTPMVRFWTNRDEDGWMKLMNFLRIFFCSTFKDNIYLESAIITGITRICKETIFSGLNNLNVVSTISTCYSDTFGFTSAEVNKILNNYSLSFWKDEIVKWYDGYTFGGSSEIYNPWSINSFVGLLEGPTCYWTNISDNSLINDLIKNCSKDVYSAFVGLLQDETYQFNLDSNISFNNFYQREKESIFSLLVASGYITVIEYDLSGKVFSKIPNFEVKETFKKMINDWFSPSLESYSEFIKSFLSCNIKSMKKNLDNIIYRCLTGFDSAESFYHGLVLGMLVNLMGSYIVLSNHTSGRGRPDVLIIPKDRSKKGYIIEFKSSNKGSTKNKSSMNTTRPKKKEILLKLAKNGLNQIERQKYDTALKEIGITKNRIIKYSISFFKSECLILLYKDNIVQTIYNKKVEEYIKEESTEEEEEEELIEEEEIIEEEELVEEE
ncbi:hypothetical protein M9Y10_019072 [Tritrichomonas musculus]|uniref:SAM-dependent MTase RsmB/NOP-type domain-containing protein n=1 Tax=Tritrichomonas musculus TaxID=1915356 RepID=A0ABR2HJL2_9EUKA